MTQALNYSTAACDTMHVLGLDEFMAKDPGLAKAVAGSARDTVILLHNSEKFILPEWGRIFTPDEYDLLEDLQMSTRLPYPITALEYHCKYEGTDNFDDRYEERCSKRIALCVETEAIMEHTSMLSHMHTTRFHNEEPGDGFYVMPIAYSDAQEIWCPPPAAMFFPRGGNARLHTEAKMCVLPLGSASYGHYPVEERKTRIARDLADESIAVCHLLMALALDHGRHEVLPSPVKLNKKRAKRGKPPLYEYKVLDIVADVLQGPVSASKPHQGGSHASPRMHKRRGHVRRLTSGKQTWVRNAIIGKPSRGQVIKDYAVHE